MNAPVGETGAPKPYHTTKATAMNTPTTTKPLSTTEVWNRFNTAIAAAKRKHLPHNPNAYEIERARLWDEAWEQIDIVNDQTDDGRVDDDADADE